MTTPTPFKDSKRGDLELRISALTIGGQQSSASSSSGSGSRRNATHNSGDHTQPRERPPDRSLNESVKNEGSLTRVGTRPSINPLPKPPICEIKWEDVVELYPHLEGVPPEYVREKIHEVGSDLFNVLKESKIANDPTMTKEIPPYLDINLPITSCPPPTHVLVLHGHKDNTQITVHLTYALVIAIYCGSISPLLFSERCSSTPASEKAKLPVIHLDIPNPQIFSLLHFYLYTQDRSALLRSLLSCRQEHYSIFLNYSKRGDALSILKKYYNPQSLTTCSKKVYAFWVNMYFLKVCDQDLWSFIDYMWDLISVALMASKGSC